jgi:IS30 family transposase
MRQHDLLISHTRIYQHIAKDRRLGGTLWRHRRHRRAYRHHPTTPRRFTPSRSLHERPSHVLQRRTIGHWELDTLRPGRGKAAILCSVERRSRFIQLVWLKTDEAKPLALQLIRRLRSVLPRVRSLTADRGSEFAWHWLIEDELQVPVYFCDPYCAWQRGTVENTNGLLRQYFPRQRNFDTITAKELQAVEDRLNDRPRKVLGFRTPREVFYTSLKRCAS